MPLNPIEKIIASAIQGNELPFNRFLEDTYEKLLPNLLRFTQSKDDAQDIFMVSMQKFWDRFVINQEKLPHNSTGYIFMMCKNAWLLHKRQSRKLSFVDNTTIENKKDQLDDAYEKYGEQQTDDTFLKHKSLLIAIEELSPKCKALIENEIDDQTQLKELQEELGFTNYQALVQAKYNCKKKLISKVYEVLERLRSNI